MAAPRVEGHAEEAIGAGLEAVDGPAARRIRRGEAPRSSVPGRPDPPDGGRIAGRAVLAADDDAAVRRRRPHNSEIGQVAGDALAIQRRTVAEAPPALAVVGAPHEQPASVGAEGEQIPVERRQFHRDGRARRQPDGLLRSSPCGPVLGQPNRHGPPLIVHGRVPGPAECGEPVVPSDDLTQSEGRGVLDVGEVPGVFGGR